MKINFLGTSAGVPTLTRNVSCVAVQLQRSGEIWLLDCGEATQHQIQKNKNVNINKITRIFITHMHGDHILGLPSLLFTSTLYDETKHLDIYGPKQLKEFIYSTFPYKTDDIDLGITFHETKTGTVFENDQYKVSAAELKHSIRTHGYRIEEKQRAGHLNVAKALADGIPEGPLFQQLKQGKTVELADGRTVKGSDYLAPSISGRSVTYCTDTAYCNNIIELAKDSDILIHEASFINSEKEKAEQYLHATAEQAAQVAKKANVKKLILFHFSTRYTVQNGGLINLEQEAKAVFPNTELANDHQCFEF